MPFGLSFGANKTKNSGTSTVDKTEVGSQTGSETTSSTNTGTQTGSSTTSNQATGSSQTSQQQTQTGTTTNTGTTTSQQSSFGDEVAGHIQSSISDILNGLGAAKDTIGAGVGSLSNFDPTTFVEGIVRQAAAAQNNQLASSINGAVDTIGGRPEDNSMTALLSQKMVGDAASNLAGITSQATATAEDILRQNLGAQTGAMSSLNNLAPALIEAFKGGNVSGTQTNLAQQIADMVGGTTGTTATSESSNQQQESAQTTIQTLAQLVNQLMATNMHTTGTQTENSTSTKMGGGFSLGS